MTRAIALIMVAVTLASGQAGRPLVLTNEDDTTTHVSN